MSEEQLNELTRRVDFLQDRMIDASRLMQKLVTADGEQLALIEAIRGEYQHDDNNIKQAVHMIDDELEQIREAMEGRR